jgi:hypothetical protein
MHAAGICSPDTKKEKKKRIKTIAELQCMPQEFARLTQKKSRGKKSRA